MAKTKQQAVVDVVLPVTPDGEPAGEAQVIAVRSTAPPVVRDTSGDGALLLGLVAGAVVGAVVGLFLAPQRGDETRQQLTRVLREEEPRQQLLDKVRGGTAPVEEALDPVAQVAQYQAAPVRDTAPPPYTAPDATVAGTTHS
jgi:hypothetical protein